MTPQEAIDFLSTLTDKQREKVKSIMQECLSVAEDRPDPELVGKGYNKYDQREKDYQEWKSVADGSHQKSLTKNTNTTKKLNIDLSPSAPPISTQLDELGIRYNRRKIRVCEAIRANLNHEISKFQIPMSFADEEYTRLMLRIALACRTRK